MNLHSIIIDEMDLLTRFLTKKFRRYVFTVSEDRTTIHYTGEGGFGDTLSAYNFQAYMTEMHRAIERGDWTP